MMVPFLISNRPLDAEILRGERIHGDPIAFQPLPAKPFSTGPVAFLRFWNAWGKSVSASRAVLSAARRAGPVQVVAAGGFVAAPVVKAARLEKIPIIMLNLDATPGRANQWIAKYATKVYTTAPVDQVWSRAKGLAQWTSIPPIVRRAARAPGVAPECRAKLGLEPDRPTLLVTGASQGAQSMNSLMAALVRAHGPAFCDARWQIIHQTGRFGTDELTAAYGAAGIPAKVEPFIREMGAAWGAADFALSRAGAGSVAEAWANLVPTIFMPYPYHKDEHQERNAGPLVRAGGAVIATDQVEVPANMHSVAPVILDMLKDPSKRWKMKAALAGLGPADGAIRVAEAILAG